MDNENTLSLTNAVAKKLLLLKTFRVQTTNPFTWANGWRAPIYFDDRKILSYPSARNFIKLELARFVAEQYPDADIIAGIASNAIAHSTLVAEQLGLPQIYIYPTPKDHGLENQIEGVLRPRQNVVIIENQVNVGSNAMKVIEAIRNNGCKVLGMVTIFNYNFPFAMRKFRTVDVELLALTDFEAFLQEAVRLETLNESEIHILREWHRSPSKWEKTKR